MSERRVPGFVKEMFGDGYVPARDVGPLTYEGAIAAHEHMSRDVVAAELRRWAASLRCRRGPSDLRDVADEMDRRAVELES